MAVKVEVSDSGKLSTLPFATFKDAELQAIRAAIVSLPTREVGDLELVAKIKKELARRRQERAAKVGAALLAKVRNV